MLLFTSCLCWDPQVFWENNPGTRCNSISLKCAYIVGRLLWMTHTDYTSRGGRILDSMCLWNTVAPSPVFSFCSSALILALCAWLYNAQTLGLCFQSGISIDTTGTTHFAGYSCITGLRCGSIEVSSRGGLENILSENLQEMFPYSCRKGHVLRRKSQKSFRIPNHPVKKINNHDWNKITLWLIIVIIACCHKFLLFSF